MGDITLTPSENLELRHRKASPSQGNSDLLTPNPTEQELQIHRKSISADPLPHDPSDLASFRSLIATNRISGDIKVSLPSTPDSTLFYIINGSFRLNTPSVTICHSTDKGPILGTLKLGWGRDNTFGLGDPAKGEDIAWENLKRTSEWTHATYEFESGRDGERRRFVWQRTKQNLFSDQPNMELREKGVDEMVGEVLGIYKGNQGMMLKSRGQFWLSPALRRESKPSWEGANGGSWSELELLALLSGLGIIEASRRRARARRGGGGGS